MDILTFNFLKCQAVILGKTSTSGKPPTRASTVVKINALAKASCRLGGNSSAVVARQTFKTLNAM